MITTGIVRYIDDLGRIIIPKEIRRVIGDHQNTDGMAVEIARNQPLTITMKKHQEEANDAKIIRHIDDMGRIVIPKELRRNLNHGRDVYNKPMEFFLEDKTVVLKPYHGKPNVWEE